MKFLILCFAKLSLNFAKFKIILSKFCVLRNEPYVRRSGVRGGAGRYSPGDPSALTQIVHYLSSYHTVFHSVMYNSVIRTYYFRTRGGEGPNYQTNHNKAVFRRYDLTDFFPL